MAELAFRNEPAQRADASSWLYGEEFRAALRIIQEQVKAMIPADALVSDELIAERRIQAAVGEAICQKSRK